MLNDLTLEKFLTNKDDLNEIKSNIMKMINELDSNKDLTYKLKRVQYIKKHINSIDDLLIKEFLFEIVYIYFVQNNEKIPKFFEKELFSFYMNNRKKLNIYNIKKLELENWTINDIVIDSVRLSAKLVDNYVIDNKDISYWINVRDKNKDLYLALVLAGIIVGHIGSIPIDYYEYKLLRKGILKETEFKNEITDIEKIEYLYIPTIVIEKSFRKGQILKNLLLEFISIINKLNHLKLIIVNAYSFSGERLSKKLGFEFIGYHSDGGKIYELDLEKNKIKLFLKK